MCHQDSAENNLLSTLVARHMESSAAVPSSSSSIPTRCIVVEETKVLAAFRRDEMWCSGEVGVAKGVGNVDRYACTCRCTGAC
jgi:hypothetical protein